jgi:transcription elongation factor GreA
LTTAALLLLFIRSRNESAVAAFFIYLRHLLVAYLILTFPMKDILLTKEGIEKLTGELERLISVDRKEIIKKIKETREYGDLSENAEYDAAREQQSMIEGRIEELEALLKKAKVIDENPSNHDKAVIGARVAVEVDGDKETYQLVSSAESDPTHGHVSVESPLGKALLGAKVGQVVEVGIPDGGTIAYKVMKIN